MESKKNFNIYVDRQVVNEVSYKKKDLLCVLALLFELNKRRAIYGDAIEIACTPSTLWGNIVWRVKPTRRDRENFMDSLKRLIQGGLVIVTKQEHETISWNTLIHLDVEQIAHNENQTFIMFCSDDLEFLVEQNYSTITTLLQLYISITSYFNVSDIRDFDEAIAKGEHPIDFTYDLYGELDYHISCWASHQRLMTTKHSTDTVREQWISKPTLIKMLDLLEELGLIAIVTPQVKDSRETFTNHYCYPRHKYYVQHIANMMAKQQVYMRDNS
ncbi:hypothetical protein [Turicibacter sanguinis]|uniref:hypothetical protein n=1 Tax=Turicibacter sanguinis TaxID=154288 RepID=UPI00325B9DFB